VIEDLLKEIQSSIYNKALYYRNEHTTIANSYDEFKDLLENKGGFVLAHWDGTSETEDRIKEETKATIRCIPLDLEKEPGTCIFTGNPSVRRVLFAKAY
jgi:prolyl-tRNA synthetase